MFISAFTKNFIQGLNLERCCTNVERATTYGGRLASVDRAGLGFEGATIAAIELLQGYQTTLYPTMLCTEYSIAFMERAA